MDNESNSIHILIADEQPIFRHGLRAFLESDPDLLVIGEASTVASAVTLARRLKPNVLLLDLALPLPSDREALIDLVDFTPPVRIIAMVRAMETIHIVDALQLGAYGIVLKAAAPQLLLNSIRTVTSGHYCLASEAVAVLVQILRSSTAHIDGAAPPKDYALTRRELDIIAKIASGFSNRKVGQEFSISERTVKHHLTNIFNKVGVSNRLALALFAINHHLTSKPACSGK